jgi:hypothetical protein
MFDACKHNTENGLPCDDSQISWMSEQWRRKEKLDSVGVAWYIACNSKPAVGGENQNDVGAWMGMFVLPLLSWCIQWPVCSCLNCAHDSLRMCSAIVQGGVDRASLAVEPPSINSPVNGGGAQHPVRGLKCFRRRVDAPTHTLSSLELL